MGPGVRSGRRVRASAGCAAVAAAAGSLGLAVAVAGMPDPRSLVSEAGVAGAPGAALYRLGVLAVAVAMGLLAVALRPVATVAALLGAAAPFAGLSGTMTCTPGCPLPPYERSTPADLVHAGASIVALGLSTLAMVLLARSAHRSALRVVSRLGVVLTLPLAGTAGFGIFVLGGGLLAGVAERAALASALAWLVTVAAVRALFPADPPARARGRHPVVAGPPIVPTGDGRRVI